MFSLKRVRGCLLGMGLAGVSILGTAAEFAGTGAGAIPDNNVNGIDVQFSVAGLTKPLSHVSLKLGIAHTYAGDVSARLTSPGGVASLIVFSRTGGKRTVSNSFGSSANLSGTYEFTDDAGNDWYAVAAPLLSTETVPPGRYRTTTAGVPTSAIAPGTNHGGCSTSLNGAFNGLPAADANGVWTLKIADRAVGDTGTVSSAALDLRDDDLFATSFEARVPGSCTLALYDYTGSGRTSFALARVLDPANVEWSIKDNDGTLTGAVTTFNLGNPSSDYLVDGDFDGDGITDAAVWREAPAGVAKFIIRRSSRPSQPLEIIFGQTNDDPAQGGDYDGDGFSDVAVFRSVDLGNNPAHTLIRPSAGGPVRDFVTGEDGNFAIGGFDYTGDGIPDIAIQSTGDNASGRIRIYSGLDGTIVRDFTQGVDSDFIVPGNLVGNGTYDITTRHTNVNIREHTTRDMGTLVVQPVVVWGFLGDISLSGDFDGDGRDDYAVWKPGINPGESQFSIRKSSDVMTPLILPMGQKMDFPPASNRVH